MANKKSSLTFRQEAIKNIASPESLNHYIEISSPGLKSIMCAIFFFLTSVVIWSIFYKINTIVPAGAYCQNGTCYCYVNETNFEKIKKIKNPKIIINGIDYKIKNYKSIPLKINTDNYSYSMHLSKLKPNDWAFQLICFTPNLPNGVFNAHILINKSPLISFILN